LPQPEDGSEANWQTRAAIKCYDQYGLESKTRETGRGATSFSAPIPLFSFYFISIIILFSPINQPTKKKVKPHFYHPKVSSNSITKCRVLNCHARANLLFMKLLIYLLTSQNVV